MLAAGIAIPASAAPATPMLHQLGTLPGYVSFSATAVNNFGIAVGYATDANFSHIAVKWSRTGVATSLGTLPGDDESGATGINDFGLIVGYSRRDSTDVEHAVEWNAQGVIKDLGASPGKLSISDAYGINDLGEVVGSDQTAARIITATRWSANGTLDNFGLANGDDGAAVAAVNDLGQMAGYTITIHGRPTPQRWAPDDTVQPLPKLPGASYGGSEAYAINNLGVSVGSSPTATINTYDAVSWDAKGAITDLGPGFAYGINDLGLIVGSDGAAITWSRGGTMSQLPELPGSTNADALAVSDTGFIAGDDTDANGDQFAVLWN